MTALLSRHQDPIIAIATAPGRGAVGIVHMPKKVHLPTTHSYNDNNYYPAITPTLASHSTITPHHSKYETRAQSTPQHL